MMHRYFILGDGVERVYPASTPAAAAKSFLNYLRRYSKARPQYLIIKENRSLLVAQVEWVKPKADGDWFDIKTIRELTRVQSRNWKHPAAAVKLMLPVDYVYCEDTKMFIDFWKYDYDTDDAGISGCKWRFVTPEELANCAHDCLKEKCFEEE